MPSREEYKPQRAQRKNLRAQSRNKKAYRTQMNADLKDLLKERV